MLNRDQTIDDNGLRLVDYLDKRELFDWKLLGSDFRPIFDKLSNQCLVSIKTETTVDSLSLLQIKLIAPFNISLVSSVLCLSSMKKG